jgi:hypothetical protein
VLIRIRSTLVTQLRSAKRAKLKLNFLAVPPACRNLDKRTRPSRGPI